MLKPQEKYEEQFAKLCYPAKAEELKESIAEGLNDYQIGYLDELIDIIYSCGYTDGYDDAKFFYERIR